MKSMKDAMVRARTTSSAKHGAQSIFAKIGITESEAIHLFYTQVMLHNGLPFEIKIPNTQTREVFEKTDRGEELHIVDSTDELFDELEI